MKRYLFLFLLTPMLAMAKVQSDEQIWINTNAFISLKNKWQLYLEVQPRMVDHYEKHGTSLYRGAIGRDIGHGFSAWMGYGFIERTFPSYLHEDRPFLQLSHSKDINPNFKLINRTRFEDRYFRGERLPSFRLRHLLRGQYTFAGSPWGVVVYDEWFWNSNNVNADLGVREGFDQNRFFIGLGRQFGEILQHLGEIGYMSQYVDGNPSDSRNDVLALQIIFRY